MSNSQGFSLLNVMIAVGITSLLSVAISRLAIMSVNVAQRSDIKQLVYTTAVSLSDIFKNPTTCRNAFRDAGNNPLVFPTPPPGSAAPALNVPRINSGPSTAFLMQNTPLSLNDPRVTVQTMSFQEIDPGARTNVTDGGVTYVM